MGIRKTQLKREQRKQRRMSLQEGTPLPPPLPRAVSKLNFVGEKDPNAPRRRFSNGMRAQSEVNLESGNWSPSKPSEAPPPRRSSFMLLSQRSFRAFGGPQFLRTLQRAPSIIENGPAAAPPSRLPVLEGVPPRLPSSTGTEGLSAYPVLPKSRPTALSQA